MNYRHSGLRTVGPRRLLTDGMALTGQAVVLVRGNRRQVDFGEAAGATALTALEGATDERMGPQ